MSSFKFILLILSTHLILSDYTEGIDVSFYQGEIDWNTVSQTKQFAILRMSYGTRGEDSHFQSYYKNAKAANVEVGAYLFSLASTVDDAIAEGNYALQLLSGKQFEWPIYYDMESEEALSGDVNAKLEAFCDVLQKNNYYCGIYTNPSTVSTHFQFSVLEKYAVWIAHWDVSQPSFDGNWGIWQYGNGTVQGVPAVCDLDYARIYYPDVIKSKGFNGY